MIVQLEDGRWSARCEGDDCGRIAEIPEGSLVFAKRYLRAGGWSTGPGLTTKDTYCPLHDAEYTEEPRVVVHQGTMETGPACGVVENGRAVVSLLPYVVNCPECLSDFERRREVIQDTIRRKGEQALADVRKEVAREVVEPMQSPEGRAETQEALRQAIHRGRQERPACARCGRHVGAPGDVFIGDPLCVECLEEQTAELREEDAVLAGVQRMGGGAPTEMRYEYVDHPAHYGGADDPYEVIKVIEAWGLNFNLGTLVRYVGRAGKKPGEDALRDLRKARWYLDREIQRRERA